MGKRGGKRIGVVMLQPSCNLTCPFCITEEGLESLTWEKAVGLLDRFAESGVGNVVLGGGEPTLWRHDVFRLAAEAKARGLFVQLGTNGVRLPEGFENHESVDRYVLPLEAADPGIHDRMRPGSKGHHAVILRRLAALAAAKKPTTVSTVITRWNRDEPPAILGLLKGLDPDGEWIHAWHLYRFLPIGRGGGHHPERFAVTPEEFDAACREMKAAAPPFAVYRRPNMYRAETVDFGWGEEGDLRVSSEDRPEGW
jgi:MoaA/NifB/PqqE/SkfB family radical SAM enzyme